MSAAGSAVRLVRADEMRPCSSEVHETLGARLREATLLYAASLSALCLPGADLREPMLLARLQRHRMHYQEAKSAFDAAVGAR